MIVVRFPNVVDSLVPEHGFTALHIAADNNHTDCVRVLIDKGKTLVNAKNKDGLTPLHLACSNLYGNTVTCLLQKGAEVNIQDNQGETALHVVLAGPGVPDVLGLLPAQHGNEEQRIQLACKLLQHGADANLRNSRGKTPLDAVQNTIIKTAVTMFIRSRSEAPTSPHSSTSPTTQAGPTLTMPCSNCLTTLVDVKLKPCGHRSLCRQCVEVVKQCPFCKQHIDRVEDINMQGNQASEQSCKVQ